MSQELTECRRSPRVAIENGTIAALHVSVPVRLLDLSSDGLLMTCAAPLRLGSTVRVVSGFAGRRLEVELSVRHVSVRRDERAGGYVVGGSFPSFDATARQIITALLGASVFCAAGEPAPRAAHGRSEAPVRGGVWRERPVRRPERPRPEQPRPEQPFWNSPAP